MNKFFAVFCVFVLSLSVYAQTTEFEYKTILDPFTFRSSTLLIITEDLTGDTEVSTVSESNRDPSILGGERDLNLRVLFSASNLVLSTSVNGGDYSASTPNGPNGNSLLVLDGIDNSTAVNRQGLNNLPESNFIGLGATAFRYVVATDQTTSVVLKVYQRIAGQNKICQRINDIPGGNIDIAVVVPFDEFLIPETGAACDIPFSRIGAIEISLVMRTAVDINIKNWGLWGPVRRCFCNCPTYTCRIIVDVDDDEYFYYRSEDFNPRNNPLTDFTNFFPSTRTVTPTTGLTRTRTPIRPGSPITISNGNPIVISYVRDNDASNASILSLAGALIFFLVALF